MGIWIKRVLMVAWPTMVGAQMITLGREGRLHGEHRVIDVVKDVGWDVS